MQPTITAEDWAAINEITASIYAASPHPDLVEVARKLRRIVPFNQAIACLIGTRGDEIEFFSYSSIDISEEHLLLYRNKYIYHDFILWYCAAPQELTFRETDIISEPFYSNSIFTREWLEPIGAHYGAGFNIAGNGKSFGNLIIYRSLEDGDFSERDLLILRTVNTHLCICFRNLFPNGIQSSDFAAGKNPLVAKYHLTGREAEILDLVSAGAGRKELAARSFLSENTVKKHLNSIFKKTGVDSFNELTRLVLTSQPVISHEEIGANLG